MKQGLVLNVRVAYRLFKNGCNCMRKFDLFHLSTLNSILVILLTLLFAHNTQAQVTLVSEGFESGTFPPTGWVITKGVGSGNDWTNIISGSAHSGTKAAEYKYSSTIAANAWLITPGYALTAGATYTITYWEKTFAFNEQLKLTVGTAQTIAAQTTTLQDCGPHQSTSYTQRTATFIPLTSNTYYFGWNCYSILDRSSQNIDDILITYIPPCSGTPTGGTTAATATFGCGYSSTLSVTGGSGESGITYQWESSADNITYSTVSGATSATYSATVTSGIYYRRGTRCTASGLTGYSTPIQLSGTPKGGTTAASPISSCSAFSSNLSVTGGSVESGTTYQWESSADNITYSTVSGATNATYTATVSSGTIYYRRGTKCTASGLTGYSTPIQLTVTTVPANNLCANATALPCGTTNLAGYTNCSTDLEKSPFDGSTYYSSYYGVWYSFVGDGYSTTISSTATFDHQMTIATGTCGGTFTIVAAKDTAIGVDKTEKYTFTPTIGTTYYVYIAYWQNSGTIANTGTFTISRSCIIPCSGTPTAGTATAAATSFTCSGSTTVSLSGYSTDTGISFLWQSSPAGTNTWSDIATATTTTLTTGTISASTDYRCKVTCANGGAFAYSSIDTVIINANAPGRAIASLETVCSGGTTYLELIGTTISNSTYQWQSSADSLSWSDIGGATANTHTTAGISSDTYFRCKITCTSSATNTYSRAVKITVITTSPGNDECTNATVLTVNSSNVCTSSVAGTIQCASASAETNTCGATLDDDDVWYKFVATQTTHLISLFNITGSTTDMTITLYSGTCGTLTHFGCLTNDQSTVTGLTVGVTYFARVYTNTSTAGQNTTFNICIGSIPAAPLNDECINATSITVNTTPTCTDYVSGTVYLATNSTQSSSCGGTHDDDVWYKFVATDTIHNISLTNIYGSTTDLYFTVSSGNCTTLTNLLCSDNNAAQIGGLTIGNTYYIRVYTTTSTSGQTSVFDLCVSSIAPTAYCKGADPFCTGTTYNFPTNINAGTGQTGPDYGCLNTQPNPVWYFLRIATAGAIQIEIESSCGDVDYAAWGPFSSITCNPDSLVTTAGLNPVNLDAPVGKMIDCAYSIAPIEYLDIPDAKVGEHYLVMINNYANCSGMFTFNKTSGYGCTDCGIVMPVELLYFEGECTGEEEVKLKWATASETNNDYYTIEGSSDAVKFTSIGKVKGAGNSSSTNNYNYSGVVKQDFTYYRLTQVDFDGKTTIFNPIHVDCNQTGEANKTVVLFPNPAKDEFAVQTRNGVKPEMIQVFTATGLKLKEIVVTEENQRIDISDLSQGLYLVKVRVNGEVYCLKLNVL